MSTRSLTTLGGPVALVVLAALLGSIASASTEIYFVNALVAVSIVVAIYVFVGNSGVLSFGHISFVAVGAWAAGVLSVPVAEKPAIMQYLFPFLRDHEVGNVPSLLIAAGVGGLYALLVGLPLMRLSGLAAGIATFGVLEVTHNVLRYYEKIGPGSNVFSSVPETTDLLQATVGALLVVGVAFGYQSSRFGRLLRATREDSAAARAVGVSVYRQRLIAFTLSGLLAGFAGGLYVHLLPINTETVYLDLTFITLAMLVIGGMTSLWGAVVRCAGGQRPRLASRGGRERPRRRRSHDRPARRHAPRRRRDADGARADPAPERHHGRPGAQPRPLPPHPSTNPERDHMRICIVGCGAVGSLFAANLATLDDVEVWAFDLYQAHVDAINANGLRLSGAGEVTPRCVRRATRRRCRLRLRHRRDKGDARRVGDRAQLPTPSRTGPLPPS